MKMEVKIGLLVSVLVFVGASNLVQAQGDGFPWTWVCESQRCLRKLKSEVNGTGVPMDVCKLNCDDLGSLWPKPTGQVHIGKELVSLYSSQIAISDVEENNPEPIREMVNEAFRIFSTYLTNTTAEMDPETLKHSLTVVLKAASNTTHIGLSTDESYRLEIVTTKDSDDNTNVVANITAATFFGLRHGLETLSQLIAHDQDKDVLQIVSNATIVDKPVFPYRGILLDTSRNFYSVEHLKRLIDGMSYNKLSVFHWHITDTHSFPMEVPSRPKMSLYGAYSPDKVYTVEAIKDLVEYARQRGVKVIPELDQPAHSGYGYQWGKEDGLGDLVVCVENEPWCDFCFEPPCGQLNIVNENVTKVVGDIFMDMFDLFDKDIFHMGGDEVNFHCYNSTKEVTDWMQNNNLTLDSDGFYQLWGDFQEKLRQKLYLASGTNDTQAILWTSGLTHPDRIEKFLDKSKYIIQIWTESKDEIIYGLLSKGYKTVFSNVDGLYLDCGFQNWLGDGHNWCSPIKGWQTIYDNNPEKIYAKWANKTEAERAVREGQILGAETPLWSEQADGNTLDSRIWPRGAAHAERLWTHPKTNHTEAEFRMVTNRQRMVSRGIMADRLQPEFCLHYEGRCYAEAPKASSATTVTFHTYIASFIIILATYSIAGSF